MSDTPAPETKVVSEFDEFDPLVSPKAPTEPPAKAPVAEKEPEGGLSAIEKIMEEQKRHDAERAKIAADDAAKRKEAEGAHEDIGVKL